ncbi:class I SAM-dependent methyltransferase [Rhodococcus sp. HNM0569]|uniref:class I SAM-dependent methyltransferase n=1 Tax=Rhodococcus sp. HNM0569 TaxID=2716340 RepID=UPI00146ED396|nr:class I SAM-dependent methyltransferase [Rhodococcus sp. HNM0569]NLU82957.1 class I SAM-dependent methyltransferase [Rhodococcus sp. HNM0569]
MRITGAGPVAWLAAALGRFNGRHPWNHNDLYAPWIASRLREVGAREVLDIGCGTGNLIARLRRDVAVTHGVEPDPAAARAATERFVADPRVTVVNEPFTGRKTPRCDAITAVAVLHHLPLVWAVREMRESLAPGGRLVIVGCYRDESVGDAVAGIASALLNPVIGMLMHPRRAASLPSSMRVPTVSPRETLAEIRAAVAAELPGARVRRRLFWRYTVVYDAPPR